MYFIYLGVKGSIWHIHKPYPQQNVWVSYRRMKDPEAWAIPDDFVALWKDACENKTKAR